MVDELLGLGDGDGDVALLRTAELSARNTTHKLTTPMEEEVENFILHDQKCGLTGTQYAWAGIRPTRRPHRQKQSESKTAK